MMLRRPQRRGTILVEAALVYPILFILIFAIIMLSLAVFRHHQVSHVAREAARWASVRGARYASETGNSAATAADVYNNSIKPQAVSMNLTALTYTVSWPTGNAQTTTAAGTKTTNANVVSVQLTYAYQTGLFGTINLTSTAVVPISY